MTHDEAVSAGRAKILQEYFEPPAGGSLVSRAWVEENFPATIAAAADVPEHLRGGWIEDIVAGNCVLVLPARNVLGRLFRRS